MITLPATPMTHELKQLIANLTNPTHGLPGWCDTEKAEFIANIVLGEMPELIIELGVFGGRSFLPLALAHRENNGHGHCIGIDPWSHSAAIEGMDPHDADDQKNIAYWSTVPMAEVQRRCADAIEGNRLWDKTALIQARAENVAHLFRAQSIDFLHIDANHSPITSCRDVELWIPKCAMGATIVFDDTDWPSTKYALELMELHCTLIHDFTKWRVYQKN